MTRTSKRLDRLVPARISLRWGVAMITATALVASAVPAFAAGLRAGVAKVDITNTDVPLVNDPLFAKALVLKSDTTTVVIVTLDVVAIAEIGSIKKTFLPAVRARLKKELGMDPASLIVNVSHCHGVVCGDVADRTVKAVKLAARNLVPVQVGVGTGHEDRVQENRRLKLKDGREVDVRRAYSLPPDTEVIGAGPIDPEIGIVRLNRQDGSTLAVLYNFAMHPIQGAANGGNTADVTGFSSQVIEDNLGHGAIALFIQGCGGDINPARYKDVDSPRDAEPLGNRLGLSVLKALRAIPARQPGSLKLVNETLTLPRADHAEKIARLEAEQRRLLRTMRGTYLNLKTFLTLSVKYNLANDFPSTNSFSYLHEQAIGLSHLKRLDVQNRAHVERYMRNILAMEQLTRIQTNLALLRKHQANNLKAGKRTIDVEVVGLRIADFVMVTFPGELTCRIGLNIKKKSPHRRTFVAGYTNGYIYYCPTAEQMQNAGAAQEDSECILAPEWQELFEAKAADLVTRLIARPGR